MVFAISGTITGVDRKLDLFGAAMVGMVTAVGGGTLRDLLIGSTPVGWMQDLNYFAACVLGILLTFFLIKSVRQWHKALFLFDALGIGVFTVLGLEKAMSFGIHPILAVLMGMMSAVFGGVIRDVLCSQVPLIFRKEIYATICLAGGAVYLGLLQVLPKSNFIIAICIAAIFIVRILAVRYSWKLPTLDHLKYHAD